MPDSTSDSRPRNGARIAETRSRPWSIQIARIAGIPIRIHATFGLLLLFVAWGASQWGEPVSVQLGLVLALFGCVLLHELGHALTARVFGIRTRDITLYPIGGVSSLESLGTAPQELVISIAGPAVNVLIAVILASVLGGRGQLLNLPTLLQQMSENREAAHPSFLQSLFLANVM